MATPNTTFKMPDHPFEYTCRKTPLHAATKISAFGILAHCLSFTAAAAVKSSSVIFKSIASHPVAI